MRSRRLSLFRNAAGAYLIVMGALFLGVPGITQGQEIPVQGEIIERVIAVVGNTPIFLSELDHANTCLVEAGEHADKTTVLRMLILRRMILAETVRLKLVGSVTADTDMTQVVRNFIDTTVRPYTGLRLILEPRGDGDEQATDERPAVGTAGALSDEVMVVLTAKLRELWDRADIRVMPGPWGNDVKPPTDRDVRCLLAASEKGL